MKIYTAIIPGKDPESRKTAPVKTVKAASRRDAEPQRKPGSGRKAVPVKSLILNTKYTKGHEE